MSQGRPIPPEHFELFLAHLREVPNVTRAARLLGHSPVSFRNYKAEDPQFSEAWDDALEESIENTEAELHRRAITGVDKPLTHQGQFTYLRDFQAVDPTTGERVAPHLAPILLDDQGNPRIATIKEYSDQLAMFLLKAHRPDKYRERQDINLSVVDIAQSIIDARKRSG